LSGPKKLKPAKRTFGGIQPPLRVIISDVGRRISGANNLKRMIFINRDSDVTMQMSTNAGGPYPQAALLRDS